MRTEKNKENKLFLIEGSTGKRYFVNRKDGVWRCTCNGWKYLKKCYHVTDKIKEVKEEENE